MTATLHELAEAALACLAARGEKDGDAWTVTIQPENAPTLSITLKGPDLPNGVPADIATPERVVDEPGWLATHRLTVRAPVIVFDLSWTATDPLRILTFSRGDWEGDLMAAGAVEA